MLLSARVILFYLVYFSDNTAASRTNFEVKRFELCDPIPGEIRFHGNITKEKGSQYLSFNMSTVAWDNNVGAVVRILTKIESQAFTELFVVREKSACKGANIFLGELWYDIERAAQLIPGVCPIRAGRYHGHHILLDFRKMSLQTFPYGTIRFVLRLVNNRNKNVLGCLLVEVENVPE